MDYKNNLQMIKRPDLMKNELYQVVGGNLLDKPTGGEKFRYFFKRAFGFFGRMAGGFGWLLGPLGGLIGSSLYQLGGLSERSADKQMAKKYQDMQVSDQLMANSPFMGATPGLSMSDGPMIENFNSDGLAKERSQTFGLRSEAASAAIRGM